METYGLIFLITVGVLYAAAIRVESVQWYDEVMRGNGFGRTGPQAHIENRYFILSILGALVVAGWFWFMKDPYGPIARLIPSHENVGWLWSIGVAYLVCIPFGLTMGSIGLLAKVRPESGWMRWVEFIISYLSWLLQGIILFHAYNPWIIWLPMMFAMPLSWIFEKSLPRGFNRPRYSTATSPSTSMPNRASSSRVPYRSSSSYPQTERRESRSSSSSSSSSSSRSESECDRIAREARAQEYYYRYQQCKDQAERLLSEAETCILSAEDNEYWARELNDSFKASAARSDRQRAERLRYESRRVQQEADRFYRLYEQYRR